MANVTVSVNSDEVSAYMLEAGEHGRFITLNLDGVSIYLNGFDRAALQYARAFVAALTTVADQLEATLPPATEPIAEPVPEPMPEPVMSYEDF